VIASLFDAAKGLNWATVTPPRLPHTAIKKNLKLPKETKNGPSKLIISTIGQNTPGNHIKVSTSHGEVNGAEGMSVNGIISGATTPTKYFFNMAVIQAS
jgi:hypothetical protein